MRLFKSEKKVWTSSCAGLIRKTTAGERGKSNPGSGRRSQKMRLTPKRDEWHYLIFIKSLVLPTAIPFTKVAAVGRGRKSHEILYPRSARPFSIARRRGS